MLRNRSGFFSQLSQKFFPSHTPKVRPGDLEIALLGTSLEQQKKDLENLKKLDRKLDHLKKIPRRRMICEYTLRGSLTTVSLVGIWYGIILGIIKLHEWAENKIDRLNTKEKHVIEKYQGSMLNNSTMLLAFGDVFLNSTIGYCFDLIKERPCFLEDSITSSIDCNSFAKSMCGIVGKKHSTRAGEGFSMLFILLFLLGISFYILYKSIKSIPYKYIVSGMPFFVGNSCCALSYSEFEKKIDQSLTSQEKRLISTHYITPLDHTYLKNNITRKTDLIKHVSEIISFMDTKLHKDVLNLMAHYLNENHEEKKDHVVSLYPR